jgi:thiol:disulfide interchange protein
MVRTIATIACLMVLMVVAGAQGQQKKESAQSRPTSEPKFDPSRNADQDIKDAIAEAKRTRRRIILDVGGEWCGWCHALDRYFTEHTELRAFREKNYVWLKINYSQENENKEVLSRYPPIRAYPHLFVLDEDGKLLHSQDTSPLEEGKSYNIDRMFGFLKKWAPQS